jgi:hypothetical protein
MYLSPESRQYVENAGCGLQLPREKVDIYAAGLILFEMCGKFGTAMELCSNLDNLRRDRIIPVEF